jgi:hypothetical protein
MKTDVRPLGLSQLEARVRAYEEHYGLPSERMTEVFVDGEPDDDQRQWSHSYSLLVSARLAVARR